jgi:predicted GTPase
MAKEVPALRGKERIVVAEIRRSFAELVIVTNPEEAFMAAVRRIAERVVREK